MAEIEPFEVYLGDGLYASFDGFQIKLRAPRIGGDDEVFLEPQVWAELVRRARKWHGGDTENPPGGSDERRDGED